MEQQRSSWRETVPFRVVAGLTVAAVAVLVMLIASQAARLPPPAAPDVEVERAPLGVSRDAAVFLGRWTGSWKAGPRSFWSRRADEYPGSLIVHALHAAGGGDARADVVYVHGSMPAFRVYSPAIRRLDAAVRNGSLRISDAPYLMRFHLLEDGETVAGVFTYRTPGRVTVLSEATGRFRRETR